MKINNEFTVDAPIDRAWALLTDIEAITPCLPGAQLTGIKAAEISDSNGVSTDRISTDEIYEGKVRVKLGPVVAEYQGTAVFSEKDGEKYRGVIDAKGRDSRGAGNAAALITVQLRTNGDSTTVDIDTDLKISGKIAQFGAGMIQEVSEKLLGQFVGCLESKLALQTKLEPTKLEPTEPEPALPVAPEIIRPGIVLSEVVPPEASQPEVSQPEIVQPEALDLFGLAGGAALKRLLPVVLAGAAAVAAVIFFLTRR